MEKRTSVLRSDHVTASLRPVLDQHEDAAEQGCSRSSLQTEENAEFKGHYLIALQREAKNKEAQLQELRDARDATTDSVARTHLEALRTSGAHGVARQYRCALQVAYAWRQQRLELARLQCVQLAVWLRDFQLETHTSTAYICMQGWLNKRGERKLGIAGDGYKPRYFVLSTDKLLLYFKSFEQWQRGEHAAAGVIALIDVQHARQVADHAIELLTPKRVWQLQAESAPVQALWLTHLNLVLGQLKRERAEVAAAQASVDSLARLRDITWQRYEAALRSACVRGRETRRKTLTKLLLAPIQSRPGRLLLADRYCEQRIVRQWLVAVEMSIVEAVVSGCTAHEAMARTCEVVKMGIANVANRMCKLSCNSRGKAAEGSVVSAATTLDVTIRLLLPLVEHRLLALACRAYSRQDAQLAAQQRRLRRLSPGELQADAYLEADAQGYCEIGPLRPVLEQLGELGYLQAPTDYACKVACVVRCISDICADRCGTAVSADDLVALLVVAVVHAELPRGYSLLQHAKQYLDASTCPSEHSYCMCTYEIAVEYVRCCGAGGEVQLELQDVEKDG